MGLWVRDLGLAWLSSFGHGGPIPCLTVEWCTWGQCVILQQDGPSTLLEEVEKPKDFFLGGLLTSHWPKQVTH